MERSPAHHRASLEHGLARKVFPQVGRREGRQLGRDHPPLPRHQTCSSTSQLPLGEQAWPRPRQSSWEGLPGSTEPPTTGPYLSEEPGWRSASQSKLGTGRPSLGVESYPAKGYDFCWKRLPTTSAQGAGAPGPGHVQPHIFTMPSWHRRPQPKLGGERGRTGRSHRVWKVMATLQMAPARGRRADSKHVSFPSCTEIKSPPPTRDQ